MEPATGAARANSFDVLRAAFLHAAEPTESALIITSDIYVAATAFDAIRAVSELPAERRLRLKVVGARLEGPSVKNDGSPYESALLQEMRSVILAAQRLIEAV